MSVCEGREGEGTEREWVRLKVYVRLFLSLSPSLSCVTTIFGMAVTDVFHMYI